MVRKKLKGIFQKPDIRRRTLERGMIKCAIGLAFVLIWVLFFNRRGIVGVFQDGFFVVGMFLLVMAWISYLGLDGISFRITQYGKKRSKRRRRGDMMDYVEDDDGDEPDHGELSEEEHHACGLVSSLVGSAIFLLPALVALLF